LSATAELTIENNAPIPTWFKIGGRADRFARIGTLDDLKRCVEIDPALRILGDGANLLVDDPGVAELVVELTGPEFSVIRRDEGTGLTIAGAGVNLFDLILHTVRQGLTGLETLGGIPATVGGAAIMNAGGKFGQFCDTVVRLHALDRRGHTVTLDRKQIDFGYRRSGLNHLIITSAEFDLRPGDPAALRASHKEIMAYKKSTQPMSANSAGCAFKNPYAPPSLFDRLGVELPQGQGGLCRISAGLLLDRSGCKGLAVGGAIISDWHANFLTTGPDAKARDVIELMRQAAARVKDSFGIDLEREVVVWSRS
jgi:UDP-N-acetylmuramate dehydrogenase